MKYNTQLKAKSQKTFAPLW